MEHKLATHYALLLGLNEDWKVEDVDLDMSETKVRIRVGFCGTKLKCPCCGELTRREDFAPERTWRHLDTMQFVTELRARVPRANCATCGVKTCEVPWAGKHSPYTWLFEAFALQVIEAAANLSAATAVLRIGWDGAHRIMKRGVERGIEKRDLTGVRRSGIDEKSFLRGQNYVSTLCDLDGMRVIEVVQGRTEEDACRLFDALPQETREELEAVAMDMWPAFINAARRKAPEAEIVFDKFHVSKHMGEAVDKVRRSEHKALLVQGDDRLKGSRYLWLYREEGIHPEKREAFDALRKSDLKTSRAWAIKELLREFWECRNAAFAETHFERWYTWAIRSRLEPVKQVARMLKRHIDGLLAYFRHWITNAATEGFNSRIQAIKAAARGFRNFENYRIRILFYCGRLAMRPEIAH